MSNAISNLFSTKIIDVYEEACKNYGNKTEVCKLCIDSCSEDAILFRNQTPSINDRKCIDCGACVSECPVNAIDHIRKPYRKIANYVKNFPQAEFTCEQLEEVNRGIKVPCLLYLDVALVSQYAGKREELHIYTGHCHTCEKIGETRIVSHFRKLEEQLSSLGFHLAIKTKQQLPKDSSEQTVNAVSRRDLFSKFSLTNIRELMFPSIEKKDPKKGLEDPTESLSIKERLHIKKDILTVLDERPIDVSQVELNQRKSSFSFQVNHNCNGCNVCERICPTDALYWEDNGDVSQLIFEENACISCFKCLACPKQALSTSDRLIGPSKKELITMSIGTCTGCGETFKKLNDGEGLCFLCTSKKLKNPSRFFTS